MRIRLILLAFIFLATNYPLVWARDVPSDSTSPATTGSSSSNPDAENTKRNVRDKSGAALTPEGQKESAIDRRITAAIRRAIVKDDSLSLNAHNVKIITLNRVVTLRGPVDSEAEKTKIAKLAQRAAGVRKVDNQLEVDVD
jgi:osmotically-inducible protein OsmY